MSPLDSFAPNRRITYYSMEIALRPEVHTYAGGRGMLVEFLPEKPGEHEFACPMGMFCGRLIVE